MHRIFSELSLRLFERTLRFIDYLYIFLKYLQLWFFMLKKAKKLGLNTNTGYITTYMDNIKLNVKSLLPKTEKGKFIAIYNPNNAECSIYTGED